MQKIKTLTISSQGQITIPKSWREKLNFSPSKKIVAWLKEQTQEIYLVNVSDSLVDQVEDSAQGAYGKNSEKIKNYLKKERASWD